MVISETRDISSKRGGSNSRVVFIETSQSVYLNMVKSYVCQANVQPASVVFMFGLH